MEFKVYPFNTLGDYFSADVMASYKGKWIFCRHKDRTTWENPAGHIEIDETPLEAAKRELYEETGAIDFNIEPLCDYYINAEVNNIHYKGSGQFFFAIVHILGELPCNSEMGEIGFFDLLPDKLTYSSIRDYFIRDLFPLALEKQQRIV